MRQGRGSEATEAVFFLAKKPLHTGVRTGCHYSISLSVRPSVRLSVCVSVSACVTFVVFTDCESCTRPIFTNLVSMEAGDYRLTRETWVLARRLEVVAVAGRLRIYSVVCFFSVRWNFVFFLFVFFSSNAHGLLQV